MAGGSVGVYGPTVDPRNCVFLGGGPPGTAALAAGQHCGLLGGAGPCNVQRLSCTVVAHPAVNHLEPKLPHPKEANYPTPKKARIQLSRIFGPRRYMLENVDFSQMRVLQPRLAFGANTDAAQAAVLPVFLACSKGSSQIKLP